jgi:hypothetical protein
MPNPDRDQALYLFLPRPLRDPAIQDPVGKRPPPFPLAAVKRPIAYSAAGQPASQRTMKRKRAEDRPVAGNQGWPSKATTQNQTPRGSTERAPGLSDGEGGSLMTDTAVSLKRISLGLYVRSGRKKGDENASCPSVCEFIHTPAQLPHPGPVLPHPADLARDDPVPRGANTPHVTHTLRSRLSCDTWLPAVSAEPLGRVPGRTDGVFGCAFIFP